MGKKGAKKVEDKVNQEKVDIEDQEKVDIEDQENVENQSEKVKNNDSGVKETEDAEDGKMSKKEASSEKDEKVNETTTSYEKLDSKVEDVSKSKSNTSPEETIPKKDENPLLKELKEAFPNMEEKYLKAVIIASQGAMDPAFNALLYLSDPESGKDIELPRQPLKETPSLPPRRKQTQLEQDEMLARQLDEQFNRRRKSRQRNTRGHERRQYDPDHYEGEDEDSWSQFVEKDLPEITARAKGSLQETATKVGTWFNGVKKNFIGENEGDDGAYYRDDAHGRDLDEQYGSYVQQQETQQRRGAHEPGYRRSDEHRLNARHRFNSFGASVNDEDDNRAITMQDNGFDDEDDEVPPQLPTRSKADNEEVKPQETKKDKLVAENNALIDTPENKEKTKKKWQPLPPEPLDATPTKVNATTKKNSNDSEDEFLINSDEDL